VNTIAAVRVLSQPHDLNLVWRGTSSATVTALVDTVTGTIEGMRYRFALISNTVHIAAAAIRDGFSSAFAYVGNITDAWKNAMRAQFGYVAKLAVAIWEKIKSPTSKFEPPSTTEYKAAMADYVKSFAGADAIVTKRTEAALAERLRDRGDGRLDLFGPCHVQNDRPQVPGRAFLQRETIRFRSHPGKHREAFGGEVVGGAMADAGGGASDEDGLGHD
jgi:hypothetical protein